MKIFRISNLLLLCVAAGFGTLLFWTSQSVQQAEDRLADIDRNVRQEQESIRVLDTEWDYLNRPQRLEELANEYLKVKPPESGNFIKSATDIPVPPSGIVPPSKPALSHAVSMKKDPASTAKPAAVPSEYIKASEKKNFETLIQSLGEGE